MCNGGVIVQRRLSQDDTEHHPPTHLCKKEETSGNAPEKWGIFSLGIPRAFLSGCVCRLSSFATNPKENRHAR